eukprot:jgi/Tetstr1/433238/TSEL_022526.t1
MATPAGEGRHTEAHTGRSMQQQYQHSADRIDPMDGWYTGYRTYAEYVSRMRTLAEQYPAAVSLLQSNRTTEIYAMRIRQPGARPERTVLLTGLQHAREWISGMVPMYLAEMIAEAHSTQTPLTALPPFEFVVVPVMNPDGYKFTYTQSVGDCLSADDSRAGICDRMWRKNRAPTGSPRGCVGIDLNRNWPVDFGERGGQSTSTDRCEEIYTGERYFEAEETLALCELLAEITGEAAELLCSPDGARRASGDSGRSIHAAIDFHAFGQLVLGAWAHTNQATRDAPRLDLIGQEMARAMHPQNYIYGRGDAGAMTYLTSGTLPDWLHYAYGAAAYTVELPPLSFSLGHFALPGHQILAACMAAYSGMYRMLELLLLPAEELLELSSAAPGATLPAQDCDSGAEKTLTVEIEPDLYPGEIGWEVTDLAELSGFVSPASTSLSSAMPSGTACAAAMGAAGFRLLLDGQLLHDGDGAFAAQRTVVLLLNATAVAARHVVQGRSVAQVVAALQGQAEVQPAEPPLADVAYASSPLVHTNLSAGLAEPELLAPAADQAQSGMSPVVIAAVAGAVGVGVVAAAVAMLAAVLCRRKTRSKAASGSPSVSWRRMYTSIRILTQIHLGLAYIGKVGAVPGSTAKVGAGFRSLRVEVRRTGSSGSATSLDTSGSSAAVAPISAWPRTDPEAALSANTASESS